MSSSGMFPADDLVVVELGELMVEGQRLGVLVDLAFPAQRGDRGHFRAVYDRDALEEVGGQLLGGIRRRGIVQAISSMHLLQYLGGLAHIFLDRLDQTQVFQAGGDGHGQPAHGSPGLQAAGNLDERQVVLGRRSRRPCRRC